MDSEDADLPSLKFHCEFRERYLAYLLPALKIIRCESTQNSSWNLEQSVKREVNMALALSASGFGWSDALRRRLLKEAEDASAAHDKDCVEDMGASISSTQSARNIHFLSPPPLKSLKRKLAGRCRVCSPTKCIRRRLSERPTSPSESGAIAASQEPVATTRRRGKPKGWKYACKIHSGRGVNKRKCAETMALKSRLKTLRELTPGGNVMKTDVLFENLRSYIISLEMQVRVLHCLADSTTIALPNDNGLVS